MGTRNLTCIYQNGDYKVAQYGQFDGYPRGQGLIALKTLRGIQIDTLASKLSQVRFLAESDKEWLSTIHTKPNWTTRHPELHRETAAKILQLIHNLPAESELKLNNNLSFAADSLFCEWAYVIDLDEGTFEVFRGFNKEPLQDGERFKDTVKDEGRAPGYHPVRFICRFPLSNLPTEEGFIEQINQHLGEDAE